MKERNYMTKPKSRHAWTVKVGERGQIVIPKEARDIFNIKPGDTLIMLGDKQQGIALNQIGRASCRERV